MSGTKTLYVLVSDGGDGSYYPCYTFNKAWVESMAAKDDAGELKYGAVGCDGDGFHAETLKVPDECTLESLGIGYDCAKSD